MRTLLAWCRLPAAVAQFIVGGASLREIETIDATPEWVRQVTLVRMIAYRDPLRGWAYRDRFARLVRAANRWLPGWLVYRLLVRVRCAAELAAMARRNVGRFGEGVRAQTGLSLAYQYADVLTICLRNPGTFPTEYYAFAMHEPQQRRLAGEITNAYQVEVVVGLVRPPADIRHGAGFTSGEIETLNDKERFRELCHVAGVAAVPSVAVFSPGGEEWADAPELPREDLFLKPLRGGEGRGAARVFYDAGSDTYRVDTPISLLTSAAYPTAPMPAPALIAWLRQTGRELALLLQPRLRAHRDLIALVGDTTLPTVRIVTVCDRAGACSVLYAYFRFAMTDISVDNGAAGGAAAMIDPTTRQLGTAATLFGGQVLAHPLTGRTLRGATVPHIALACQQTLQMHRALASSQDIQVPVIGWDVALTDAGPIVTEGNALSAISTPQKLVGGGSWGEQMFRHSLLSYLVPLAGRRISVDPGPA